MIQSRGADGYRQQQMFIKGALYEGSRLAVADASWPRDHVGWL